MKYLKIKNFQSHKNTSIVLDKYITAIIGKSNHGKSSIRRAIEWVVTNKPQGTAFIRKGTSKTSVVIDDVEHIRTESVNAYKCNGNEFKALRGKVPEEVHKALNLDEINIQDQHSSIFLLQDTPGKVAQKLSELSNIEEALLTLKEITRKKNNANIDVKFIKKEYDASKKELFRLRFVTELDDELRKIEQKAAEIEKIQQDKATLYTAIEKAKQAAKRLNELPSTAALQPAKQILEIAKKVDKLKTKKAYVKSALDSIQNLTPISQCDPSELFEIADTIKDINTRVSTLNTILKILYIENERIQRIKQEQAELEHKKAKLLKGKCPLCGK